MGKFFLIVPAFLLSIWAKGQMYMTRNGSARLYSNTALENIDATNKQVRAIIDPNKNAVAASLLLKGFLFQKALMQEHFNENYVESDRFPKADFEGVYTGPLDISKPGIYKVTVRGKLSLHGVSREMELPGTIEVRENLLVAKTVFLVIPEDFQIKIPGIVRDKISKKIEVTVVLECKKQ